MVLLLRRPAVAGQPVATDSTGDPPPESLHTRRVRRMLAAASIVTVLASLAWGAVFIARGNGLGVALELLSLSCGIATEVLARRGHIRAASLLMVSLLYLMLSACALLLDLPSAGVPRSIHGYLIAVGVAACLLLHDERPLLRHGLPLLCLATGVLFGATDVGIATPLALPDGLRAHTIWINHALPALLIFVAVRLMQAEVAERGGLVGELRDAAARGEMQLYYQPQVGADGRTLGAEALLRWRHPRRGMVSPGEFIPLAERSGLMLPLGDWVLRAACAQLAAWGRRTDTSALVLSINVSATQFAQPDFVERVLTCLEAAGANPTRLKLELTESMLAHDVDGIAARMQALKAHGIGLSLDDFGTGFSSLSYLRRLPLDQLKIDQSFVRDMLRSTEAAAIAQTVITLGHSLGLQVIAEGVETFEQRQLLAVGGCDAYQGYLYSRPLPLAPFEAWVARAASPATPPTPPSRPAFI
ncbi:EAL domain-containing protein [Rubrivivax sp. A210]|uniref:putative bifunctional diguanylate cyclase/phosphodiesterase n=1 Tax=Rubrivivax sp. A210 TaxID=2772301 RepID=UPI00191AF217|nr:EAL domain-containing protein [Rubrivivax sp. A210]CAD5367372.1 EAL domain-containing protein [Rubrivivax sp. A210]